MTSRQTIKRFLEPALSKDCKELYFLALIFALFGSFYEVFSVIILEKLAFSLQNHSLYDIYTWIIIFFLGSIVYFVYKVIYKRYNLMFIGKLSILLDKIYLSKFIELDNNDIEKIGTGRMISIMGKGLKTRGDFIRKISADYLRVFLGLIISLIYISSKGIYFMGLSFMMLLVSFIWVYFLGSKSIPRRNKAKENNIEYDRTLVRRMMSKYEIMQSDKINIELSKSVDINTKRVYNKTQEKWLQGISYDGMGLLINISICIIICYISLGIYYEQFDYSTFILFSGISVLMSQKIASIADIVKDVSDHFIDIIRLRDVVDDGKKISGYNTGSTFSYKSGNIYIDNISFAYNDNNKLFDSFSINILGSQKTALVGPSGGGKSTLIKLIAGYIRPDIGNIYIDDQDLLSVSLKSYYKHVGYLTQEPSVFDGTIRENLMYGISEDNTDNTNNNQNIQAQINKTIDIDNIIKLSKCEWIYNLKDGLDTEIGEKGIRLSGGQRQRLAIAKIMLKDPDIILLDEPTSALDSENEELITQALNNLFENKTVIIIAHRLQTVKNSNDIIYINNGNIIQRGTHEELLSKGGDYAKMVELQSGF